MDKNLIENPKVSVIIPVYNTEKYLREALDSIVNQTLKEIEIITINDGSTDSSLDVLNEYAKKDNRIIVYSQENQGQAIARNFGIEKSKGKYIYFFDSDDILLPTALEETYNKCEKDNLDLCFFDADIFYDGDNLHLCYDYLRCSLLEDKIYKGIDILQVLLSIGKFRVAPWLYLIKKSFLIEINLHYERTTHEDELFSSLLYLQANKVGFVPKVFFMRRIRESSVVTSLFSDKNLKAYFFIVDNLMKYSNGKDPIIKSVVNYLCKNIINNAVYRANKLKVNKRIYCVKEVFFRYLKFIKFKSILVCLFPFLIRIKSLFK